MREAADQRRRAGSIAAMWRLLVISIGSSIPASARCVSRRIAELICIVVVQWGGRSPINGVSVLSTAGSAGAVPRRQGRQAASTRL